MLVPGVTAGRLHLRAFLCCLLAAAARAEEKVGQIRGRVSIPQKFAHDLPPGQGIASMRVILDGGMQSALPTADGYFLIGNVAAGPHLLQVVHPKLLFDPVRVEAQEGTTMKMSAYLADFEHGRGAKLKYPLGLAPSGAYSYLEKREEFNILSVFKSPMALISLFSFGAMLLLPKLQPMIEEEKNRQRLEQEAKREADGNERR
uniref:ER membrane protein complex subunit 7 beta-sandwich domain-containing protein n=1 Tax=Alexandrium monilatum TaxID=311494 RepID=A0A7S4UBF5_9DINO|mmetsp:Transcript_10299/g.31040  ORF Transcript_10299/g.31040 Transcript_10299/m.31040 type:complete len:203 (-) Transcript_10299:67-675(-)